jgi:DNA transformation protein
MSLDPQTRQAAEDLVDALLPLEARVRPMFGGYCVYIDGKVVGLVCDGRIFVKPSNEDALLNGYADPASAYSGAKPSWRLPLDSLRDNPEHVIEIFRATARALPTKPPRKKMNHPRSNRGFATPT